MIAVDRMLCEELYDIVIILAAISVLNTAPPWNWFALFRGLAYGDLGYAIVSGKYRNKEAAAASLNFGSQSKKGLSQKRVLVRFNGSSLEKRFSI
jgi:hypothetical protein